MINEKAKNDNIKNMKIYFDDACEMKNTSDNFDVIVGSNLIDRLPDPIKWIQLAKSKVNENGIVINCDPFTWLAEYTPVDKWLGGVKKGDYNYFTNEGLKDAFGPEFEQIDSKNIPFVI